MERYANVTCSHQHNQKVGNSNSNTTGNVHLRKVLNVLFPSSYIKLYHQPPNAVCSLLNTTCWTTPIKNKESFSSPIYSPQDHDSTGYNNQQDTCSSSCLLEPSADPSSRSNIINLQKHFDETLIDHQAKPVGLCPIRRCIYDQCFDELIRQVTVSCIEQGLLLFRIRNELRMTLNYYKKAYESGVEFGLNKAIEAEMILNRNSVQIRKLEQSRDNLNSNCHMRNRISDIELRNKLESVDKMKEYYKAEISKKDKVIEQQRAIIKALSRKLTSDIKSPI